LPERSVLSGQVLHKVQQLPTFKESPLFEKLARNAVRCKLCEKLCALRPGELGDCRARVNLDGKLYTLDYGNISAIESRPIEIKPFFHYWPGSSALTFSTWSCNLDCAWCQNYSLSKVAPEPSNSSYCSPQQMAEMAVDCGDDGLCASFQEPTLLTEWAAEAFAAAHNKGLYCCFVSNGYMTLQALRFLADHGMDAIKIDVKGDSQTYRRYCGGVRGDDVVWRNAKEAKRLGLHVEIVNLVVTTVNDDENCLRRLVQRHVKEVGVETPLHFTRYRPEHKFINPATKIATLELAYRIARSEGALFPYIGNVSGHPYENTYCPKCQKALIRRAGCFVSQYNLTEDARCASCRSSVPIVGKRVRRHFPRLLWT
jgi:pyruvate formate lyase activating enzyme